MGVYIKNMEMPFTCLTCDFHKCAGGVGDFCSLTKRRQFRFKNRPEYCPLIEVPKPHGRLSDADALADVFRGFIAMYDSCPFSQLAPTDKARRDELQSALAEVINAPTIIEAEEGEI